MRKTSRLALVVVLLFVRGATGTLQAADRDTLKGLLALDLRIEELSPEAERDGLTVPLVRGDIESQLRQGGLNVTEDATENFYVNINAHPANLDDGRYIYNIEVRVSQPVVVLRTNGVTMAGTWSRAMVGTAVVSALPGSVRRDLRQLLTTFLTDYSTVNPRP